MRPISSNLRSTVEQAGQYVNQIILFSGGQIRTFEQIDTSTIEQNLFTVMLGADKRKLMINTTNVDAVTIPGSFDVTPTADYIFHFSGGNKMTIRNVAEEETKDGEFLKIKSLNKMILINRGNLDCIESFSKN